MNIPVEKQVFNKSDFSKVINTNFNQLINNQNVSDNPTFTIDDFFELYEQLFYQIPKEGDTNSHRYIIEKEAEYLGLIINQDDVQALLEEITTLRQQLLDTQTSLDEINKIIKK
jgi:hypothetical protein